MTTYLPTLAPPRSRGRWASWTASALAASAVCVALSAPPAEARKSCGTYRDATFGRIAVTVEKGRLSCKRAKRVIRRAADPSDTSGTPTGAGNVTRYPDGWLCGGQMGQIICAKPSYRHPRLRVTARALD